MGTLKTDELITNAEKKAKEAQQLSSFSNINLDYLKKELSKILDLIGRQSIFDEYTLHDITHINSMLKMLDWIIPIDTKEAMTTSEWMMVVLSIYFHDLGMLVTKTEYENRNCSSFKIFKNSLLKDNKDLQEKLKMISSEDKSERFLYQEFVRNKHAERIKLWIMGDENNSLGFSAQANAAIGNLLKSLDIVIRRDLAMICESHHLNDLDHIQKYKIRQSYGNDNQEVVNLQYISILLRTTDLLHITKDRTPSIQYLLIDPQDPISQDEWAKQMAVRSVLPQPGINKDNLPDENVLKDTIEVFATFSEGNENGFFGLTSYLNYAQKQLRQNNEWATKSNNHYGSVHKFPWRHIDQKNIETIGFLQQKFEFKLDQTKILDLLIGHTIYNDTNVVVRELIQNAIDAVRLQSIINKNQDYLSHGKVVIEWNEDNRILSVKDNGTGMTQEVIEKHLLNAGSSRYQDNQFKEDYPEFSAISRFGIGILSTFMVADTVEIITNSSEEEEARHLTLKSVHGKYLVKLLNKNSETILNELSPHGTLIRLKLRPSAKLDNLIQIINKWIIIPPCEIEVKINDSKPINIGYPSPKEAIEFYIKERPQNTRNYLVKEKNIDGVTVAYALFWSEYTSTWNFLGTPYSIGETLPIGTCIEGIRVEFTTAGLSRNNFISLANISGPNSPKTNVARSGIENNLDKERMQRIIYQIYIDHVMQEMIEMQSKRGYSLTWAIRESESLINMLLNYFNNETLEILRSQIDELKLILIEGRGTERENISINEWNCIDLFWTIDSQVIESAENIIKEISHGSSLNKLFENEKNELFRLPNGVICPGNPFYSRWRKFVFEFKEITEIKIIKDQRRIDYAWGNKYEENRWLYIPEKLRELEIFRKNTENNKKNNIINEAYNVRIATDSVKIIGNTNEIAVKSYGKLFLLPNNPLSNFCAEYLYRINSEHSRLEDEVASIVLLWLVTNLSNDQGANPNKSIENLIDIATQELNVRQLYGFKISDILNINELERIIISSEITIFNPSAWQKENGRLFWQYY